MEFSIRPITLEERKYTYAQSAQLAGQTGNVGRLRGDFGSNGMEFWTTWEDNQSQWKTDEFKTELDDIINALRSDKYGLLKNRSTMVSFARAEPDSEFMGNYTTEYGFRVDTKEHTFLIRCNPQQGDYNFYCFCYVSKWLDEHMKRAERGIRFLTPDYKEKFKLVDGDKVRIALNDGTHSDSACRYIDDYHLEVRNNIYHICEFAEHMERNGNTVIPLRSSLPEQCFVFIQSENKIGAIQKGEKGYYRTDIEFGKQDSAKTLVDELNEKLGVTKAQAEAMKAGSMFGWEVPAADPKSYNENGTPIKPKRNKEYER